MLTPLSRFFPAVRLEPDMVDQMNAYYTAYSSAPRYRAFVERLLDRAIRRGTILAIVGLALFGLIAAAFVGVVHFLVA